MKKQVVITGINGFVGHHLARKLHAEGFAVIGIGQDTTVSNSLKDIISSYHCVNLVEKWPDIPNVHAVIHLAGLAAVGPSFENPQSYINFNSAMFTNLAEYYLKQAKKPRILAVSSGAVYDSTQPMPIKETSPVAFSSPYALSKVLIENQCAYYRNRGLDCIVARPFNHTGPGQGKGFIIPDFYERIQLAQDGATIQVGNIKTRRDYTDVRDIVEAYVKLVSAPKLLETTYNVCSGKSMSGKELLDKLKNILEKPKIHFEIDPALIRPNDAMEIYGDANRLKNELGWKPAYSIDTTIQDFVTHAK